MLTKRHFAVICGVVLLSLSAPSFATVVNITDMQYYLDNYTTCYSGDSSGGTFSINEQSYFPYCGLLQASGGTFSSYNINSGVLSWSGAARTAEQSGTLAKAWFSYDEPVTLSISGELCEDGVPIFTGVLIEAQIKGDLSGQSGTPDDSSFCVWELPAMDPDVLAAHVLFDIKGGELYAGKTGKETNLVMNDFELSMELLAANFLSQHVQNFNSDVYYDGRYPAQMLMTVIPEPVTIILFALGGIGILRRRRLS